MTVRSTEDRELVLVGTATTREPVPLDDPFPDADTLASVCHDLRQHIAIGLLLCDDVDGERLAEPVRHRFELLHEQFEHTAALVALLTRDPVSRRARADLAALTSSIVEAARAQHRVSLEIEGEGSAVRGDPVLLHRAVANLIDNACHAGSSGGLVRVRVGRSAAEHWVEVIDDGPGFGNVETRTGRGLKIVMAAVRACDGQLRISGADGGGTVVRLTLPAGDLR